MRRQRNAKRRPANFTSYIRCGAFQRVAIVIEDISFGGVSATSDADLRSGMPISVEVPTIGLVRAKVMWTDGRRFGASFLKPVDVRKCFPGLISD